MQTSINLKGVTKGPSSLFYSLSLAFYFFTRLLLQTTVHPNIKASKIDAPENGKI
jgi:hypothetical protein